MSWASKGSINLKRERLRRVAERTEATTLPTVEEVFARADDLDADFARDIIDKIHFSTFPGAKEGGAAAIRGFLTNESNRQVLKSTGAVGAVIEMLHRIDIAKEADSEHGQNLLPTLHILAMEDVKVQQRLLANHHSLPILLELCRVTSGETQVMAFDIVNALSYLDGCLHKLIELDMLPLLFSAEMMYRKSTDVSIRHRAVTMIHRITVLDNTLFPVDLFEEVVLDKHKRRRIDGHMEVHLLSSFLLHITDKRAKGGFLEKEFRLFPHLVGEVIHESFEDLDHMVQILKCVLSQVRIGRQSAFLMEECGLATCLQLIVKTNYALMRRSAGAMQSSKVMKPKKDKKTGKIDNRPMPTQMALALVRPQQSAATRNEDVNFSTTKMALEIYQELIVHQPEIIAALISSGLIPALLFRVGNGPQTDWRFNKIVTHFVYLMMMQIADAQPDKDMLISLIALQKERLPFYATLAFEADESRAAAKLVESLRAKVASYKDIRLTSDTMAAHGLTDALVAAIYHHEEPHVMAECLRCLALMKFSAIADAIYKQEVLLRLVSLFQRSDCMYSVLSIVLDAVLLPDITADQLNEVVKAMVFTVLIRALSLSGWAFKLKGKVYRAIAVMSQHPSFMGQLLDCGGMGTVLTMLSTKKKNARSNRRGSDGGEDDSTEQLLKILRKDWAMSRIQSHCRAKLVRMRPPPRNGDDDSLSIMSLNR